MFDARTSPHPSLKSTRVNTHDEVKFDVVSQVRDHFRVRTKWSTWMERECFSVKVGAGAGIEHAARSRDAFEARTANY